MSNESLGFSGLLSELLEEEMKRPISNISNRKPWELERGSERPTSKTPSTGGRPLAGVYSTVTTSPTPIPARKRAELQEMEDKEMDEFLGILEQHELRADMEELQEHRGAEAVIDVDTLLQDPSLECPPLQQAPRASVAEPRPEMLRGDSQASLTELESTNTIIRGKEPAPLDSLFAICAWPIDLAGRTAAFVSFAEDANIGFRNYMEDGHKVVDPYPVNGGSKSDSWGFYAVYDGHGGRDAVEHCETKLHDVVLVELSQSRDPRKALLSAFRKIDSQLAMLGAWNHGCTTTVALVHRKMAGAKTLYVANVGDSRALLLRFPDIKRLTRDHRPDDPSESRRVVAAGGKVQNGRVGGRLAISRSLGDHYLKGSGVSGIPDVCTVEELYGEIMILASDGLWDVLSDDATSEKVESFVRSYIARGGSPPEILDRIRDNLSQDLVSHAKMLGSRDNILCLAIFL